MEAKHEERLTKLEADFSHMTQSVTSLTKTVSDGFAEMRKIVIDIEKNSEDRASRLHQRLEQHQAESAEERKLQWPLVISFILLIIAIGGVISGYVNMTTNFEARIAKVERDWLLKYMEHSTTWDRERCDLMYKMHEAADQVRAENQKETK